MSRLTEKWRVAPQTEADVLARLRKGPLSLRQVNADLKIAPTTFKSIVWVLRRDGHRIEAEREATGKGCNVYTLVDHAG